MVVDSTVVTVNKQSGFYTVRIMPFAAASRASRKPRAVVLHVGADEALNALDAATQAAERYAAPKGWRRVMVRRRVRSETVFEMYRFLTRADAPQGNLGKLRREHVANIVVESG